MDCLDTSLHQQILSALAGNLASTSSQDDLSLLTQSFSSVQPAQNGQINGIVSRLEPGQATDGAEVIETQQAESMIAFAEYAANQTNSKAHHERLSGLLSALPHWKIESPVGMLANERYSLPDQLAYALTHAILKHAGSDATAGESAYARVTDVQQTILNSIQGAPGARILTHFLPILNGIRRATTAVDAKFAYLPSAAGDILASLTDQVREPVQDAIAHEWNLDTIEGRQASAMMTLYNVSEKGLTASFPAYCQLEAIANLHTKGLASHAGTVRAAWEALLQEGAFKSGSTKSEQTIDDALTIYGLVLKGLENDVDSDGYAFEILQQSLKLATLTAVASRKRDERLDTILESLVAETSIVSDEHLQTAAVECIQILALSDPSSLEEWQGVIRRFLVSPAPVFEQPNTFEAGPSTVLKATAKSYATLIKRMKPVDEVSAVQSLFKHFALPDREGALASGRNRPDSDTMSIRSTSAGGPRSLDQRRLIAANIAHLVSSLSLSFDTDKTCTLVTTMLIGKLHATDELVDGSILFALADMASIAPRSTFNDILGAFAEVMKATSPGDVVDQAVSTTSRQSAETDKLIETMQTVFAFKHLATTAAKRNELHKDFLVGSLKLFVERSINNPSKTDLSTAFGQSQFHLAQGISTFMRLGGYSVRSKHDEDIVAAFRSFWFVSVLGGIAAPSTRMSRQERATLTHLATLSPPLLLHARPDFVETELEYNSLLRKPFFQGLSTELKGELSSALSSQAGAVRALSAPQSTFCAAVYRIETLRAEAGQPTGILQYFTVEDVNNSALFPVLQAIADQITRTFCSHLSDLATRHAMEPNVAEELRELVLSCADKHYHVRAHSFRAVNDIFSSFPSLLCSHDVVCLLLEMLTMLRRACQASFMDEYTPAYSFHSHRANFTLTLSGDYSKREAILSEMNKYVKFWLRTAITRAPYEMQSILQDYIEEPAPREAAIHLAEDDMGRSVALDLVRILPSNGREASLPAWGGWKADNSARFARSLASRSFFDGSQTTAAKLAVELDTLLQEHAASGHAKAKKTHDLRSPLYRCAAFLVKSKHPDLGLLHALVTLPVTVFTDASLSIAQEVWSWVADSRPDLEVRLMIEVTEAWIDTIRRKKGLFSDRYNRRNPLDQPTQFTPTDKTEMTKEFLLAAKALQPHAIMLSFLSSRFQAFRYREAALVTACQRMVSRSCLVKWSTHNLARELRFKLLSFGFCILQGSRLESAVEYLFRDRLYKMALAWFSVKASWTYGSNRIQMQADIQALEELIGSLQSDQPAFRSFVSATDGNAVPLLPYKMTRQQATTQVESRKKLLLMLLRSEVDRLHLWINPLSDASRGPVASDKPSTSDAFWRECIATAWSTMPSVAIHLYERYKIPFIEQEVTRLVRRNPALVRDEAEGLAYFIGESISPEAKPKLRHLIFWSQVPVISALRFLFPKYGGDPILLQYALRVLEHHPVETTFFYIPQIVQALRTDDLGYAERFIFETSKISQLFCHQIIWNMKANMYRDDEAEEEDPMKPTLDRMVDMIVDSLSGEARDFYKREFDFFDEVTSISGKLKPFIKSPKPEKKAKIDEEIAKIKVDKGVYLPSNPDGVVVDIDRKSGRPLQSAAKAPFMATFKVRRERKGGFDAEDDLLNDVAEESPQQVQQEGSFDTWQAAIFKVGDDCRQDVLALQIIAMQKNICSSLGLDLLLTPYRVTATGPGCGVIDVIPNATSRDEMGRAKVNNLNQFYINKYGSVDSIEYEQARVNFIQSMAAYSVICHLIQIRDRHNGNIMIDGRGCLVHIDFGFLFDIGPGGMRFEPFSFKLSNEMLEVMGGKNSEGYRQFRELTVKAYLACRPYAQAIAYTADLMKEAGFPSYKDEGTVDRLKKRFRLDLTEKEAAEHMKALINDAELNIRSTMYDQIQKMQNGIPYVR